MRLKTKLVVAITTLVLLLSGMLSVIYVGQLLYSAVRQSYDTNYMVAEQIRFALQNALEVGLRGQSVDPNNPAQLRNLEALVVRNNARLQAVIDSVNRYSPTVYDINIGDNRSTILLSTNPDNEDAPLPVRPGLDELLNANPVRLMGAVFGPPRVYDIALPIEIRGKPFVTVHVGVRTTFLRAAYEPWMKAAFTFMSVALAIALIGAILLSNLALRPLEQISRQLDYWSPGDETAGRQEGTHREDMAIHLSNKIERFGQRARNVEEVYSALKENLDRILSNLQDGILLFTANGSAVLVSGAVHRFLPAAGPPLLGKTVGEIFDHTTAIGKMVCDAFQARRPLQEEEILTEGGKRVQLSIDFISDTQDHAGLGALVLLHDLESAEEIESELELSRRMAAIGRLTSGVGHEVKNPINAIVLHLELLKNKLSSENSRANSHLTVIETEIHRLDRVVQMLVDFSRPVELQLREHNLATIVNDVLLLVATELASRNVTLISRLPTQPLMVNVDADLLKQAILNVVRNGAQAMPGGGTLEVILEEGPKAGSLNVGALSTSSALYPAKSAVLCIADQGPGIPEEIREKIFDLYFTTKSGGSGIGLAMTARILQLHHGSIDVDPNREIGAAFLLRIPLINAESSRRQAGRAGFSARRKTA